VASFPLKYKENLPCLNIPLDAADVCPGHLHTQFAEKPGYLCMRGKTPALPVNEGLGGGDGRLQL
jgi:hypothetical protein